MPVDIALFGLHGAMVADGYEDCEGDLLARAREIVGPEAVIGAEYDLHCHLTEKRVAACDLVVLFKEFPHTDFLARAEDLVDLALRTARGEIRPDDGDVRLPHAVAAFMTNQPRRPRASSTGSWPWRARTASCRFPSPTASRRATCRKSGFRILVITDGDKARAAALAEELGREVLAMGRAAVAAPLQARGGHRAGPLREAMAAGLRRPLGQPRRRACPATARS